MISCETKNLPIKDIKVAERIRKNLAKIDELAASISERGLLHPVTVMPLDGGQYQLLAGLRRLRAVESLGRTEIEAKIVEVQNAEDELRIEYMENEQRENFTFSEKMDYARIIEEIEKEKARERKTATLKQNQLTDTDPSPYRREGETRNVVGEKIGISGRQYDRAKYIASNADESTIEKLDRGETTIRKEYDLLINKAKESPVAETEKDTADAPEVQTVTESSGETTKKRDNSYAAVVRGMTEATLMKNPIYVKLKEAHRAAEIRGNIAECNMYEMERTHKNQIYHFNSVKDSLKMQIGKLENIIAEARERIAALEAENAELRGKTEGEVHENE